jgi:hypothetical protein
VPVPSSSIPSGRPWVVASVLVLGLGGVAIAAERQRPGSQADVTESDACSR